MFYKRLIAIIIIAVSFSYAKAQNKIDSLKKIGNNSTIDSLRYAAWFEVGSSFKNSNPDTAIVYFEKARIAGERAKEVFKSAEAKRQIGWCYYLKAEYDKALSIFNSVLSTVEDFLTQSDKSKKYKSKKIQAAVLNNIGSVYDDQGNHAMALDNYFKALKVAEEIDDKNKVASVLGNIYSVYKNKKDYVKALDYSFKSLKMAELLGDNKVQANAISNIGVVYKIQADEFTNVAEKKMYYEKALEYYFKGVEMAKKMENPSGLATNYGNIGNVLSAQAALQDNKLQKDHYLKKSLEYHFDALTITDKLGKKESSARHMENIGAVYLKLGNFNQAEKYLKGSLEINNAIGAKNNLLSAEREIYQLYDTTKKYREAYFHFRNYISIRDTVNNAENERMQMQLEMSTKYEKQQSADSIRNAEKLVQEQLKHEQEIKSQRNLTYGGIIGFVLMMMVAFTSFRAYKQKQKASDIISKQKRIVEEKQKEILDSIHYAQRIQQAILPNENEWKNFLPESFVLYIPKDIVAGDFYWLEPLNYINENAIMFAAADCTGHGVPGALVSVVCSNALSKSVLEEKLDDPAKVLDKTRDIVIEKLSKSNAEVKDGMDISLCYLNKNTLTWSGANNPLWLIKDNKNEIIEITADKQPIGKYAEIKPFTSHTISLSKGDIIYLFTDGFADQFGGPKGKKFKYKQFSELLVSIKDQPMERQKELIKSRFNEWKGDLEQVDDVCVIGVRIS